MPRYTAIVTLLAIALYFFFAELGSRSRMASLALSFRPPPAISISNACSARMRTRSNGCLLSRCHYHCAIYLSDITAAALGLLWIVGRVVSSSVSSKAVEKRLPGFFIQSTACMLLFVGAAAGVVIVMQ